MKVVMDKKESNKRNKGIENGLQSTNSIDILRAIKMLRKDGEAEHIALVIKALHNSNDDEVSNDIVKFLNDLKIQIAMPPIMEALGNKDLEDVHVFLLQAIWNSRLDATPHVEELVNLATKSDYLTCLEVLTIIENLEVKPDDEVITAMNTQIRDALLDNKESRELLISMMETLNEIMIG